MLTNNDTITTEKKLQLDWVEDEKQPGALQVTYKERELRIVPKGDGAFNGFVDDAVHCGGPDQTFIEHALIGMVDSVTDIVTIEETNQKTVKTFADIIDGLGHGTKLYGTDPLFGYKIYRLPNEDQARIFRIPTKVLKDTPEVAIPTEGNFVGVLLHPEDKHLCLAYCEYPKGAPTTSVVRTMLAYHPNEMLKGSQHIVDWLEQGVTPIADGEYAPDAT